MPSEYDLLVEEFRKNPGIAWLLKPFDLRVYALVTSYIPLKAWLYRGGFAHFSNTFTLNSRDERYILPVCVCRKEGLFSFGKLVSADDWQCQFDKSARTEVEVSVLVLLLVVECWQPFFFLGFAEHVYLTNVAVQKAACGYDPGKGCKRLIQQLGQHSTAKRGAGSVEFVDTDNAFIRSLRSVQKVIIGDKCCFELYSYDVLIHQDLKPWLLEVNASSPSLTASSQEDSELKCHLLKDTLHIVDGEGRLTGKEKRVGGFDLIRNDGPVRRGGDLGAPVDGNAMANAHFSCYGDGKKQLKQLFRDLPAQQNV
ncbi:LOW QUALITY PROTEIN: putative tubulin polyglutamylase TTLL9 [Ciconia maguari]